MTDVKDPTTDGTAEAPPPDPNAVAITVNGRAHTARKGQLLIDALADAGEYVPRFCYHERMNPVGKCRMCLVEADGGRGPAVTVSCMVPVSPDMKVDTESPTTKRMQEGVLELLLANHPLDCPVCDKGGECPLQDQAFSHGPGESRYVEEKRHYEKPIPISDLVYLDRERCILCDRCTRFADEVAGDPLIHFTGRGNNTYISTYPDEPFSSYFSGNTVQICPVGALTAKPYRFKARPWDLQQSESTCTSCSVGCRTAVQSSRDESLRYQGVDSDPVNWGWLCDRGRFGFEAVNSGGRLTTPLQRSGDTDTDLQPVAWNAAYATVAAWVKDAVTNHGAKSVAVLGGARGSNEDAFAWARLAHDIIGTPNVSAQISDGLPAGVFGLPRATIADAASASTVILLGPDLKQELPVLYLRLRDSVQRKRTRIIEFTPKPGGMTSLAWRSVGFEPGTQAAAVANTLADAAVAAQLAAGSVVVVAGRANLAESSAPQMQALQAVLAAVPSATVLPALRRGNVVGAIHTGMRPGERGLDSKAMLQAAAAGKIELLFLVGADPLADCPDTDLARRALSAVKRIVAVDTHLSASSSRAHLVLAAAAYAEKAGTTTNLEGRVTSLSQQVTPTGTSRPDWMIAAEIALAMHKDLGVGSVDELTAQIAEKVDGFAAVTAEALAANSDGVLAAVPTSIDPANPVSLTVAERNAYDFRLVVSRRMYDQAVGTQQSSSMAHLASVSAVHVNPLDIERVGAVAGADVKVTSLAPNGTGASLVFTLVADDTVLRGTAWVPFNQPGPNVGELIDATAAVTDVRIETVGVG